MPEERLTEIYYRNNGDYPPPEEIAVTKGVYRLEGIIEDFTPDEPVQYLDADAAIECEGELKRLHFIKLDVLSDGRFVAIIDVIDNIVWLTFLLQAVCSIAVTGGIISVTAWFLGEAAEKAEETVGGIAESFQWIAVIVITISFIYVVRLFKK